MASKYVDYTSMVQVIGCTFKNPQLLDLTDKYNITEDDFTDDFHRITFGAIYKLHELGAKKISLENISGIITIFSTLFLLSLELELLKFSY